MWKTYLQPCNLNEALALLDRHAEEARIVAGGTDVLVELSRGVKRTETPERVFAALQGPATDRQPAAEPGPAL
jgi:CO/xanthine dehydrogenase FAD-binding subunit